MKINIQPDDIYKALFTPDLSKIDEIKYKNLLDLFKFKKRTSGKKNWYFYSFWIKSYTDRYYNLHYYGNNKFVLHLNYKSNYYGDSFEYLQYNKHCNEHSVSRNKMGSVYSATWTTDIEQLLDLLTMLFPKELRSEKIKNIINEK
jgi:hypothetical protein